VNALWSWVLMAVGVTGLWVAGRRPAVGWGIGVAAQVLWVAYALATAQLGFLVSAGVYGSVYLANWRRAHRVDREAACGCPAA
jgi:hypothetical protein